MAKKTSTKTPSKAAEQAPAKPAAPKAEAAPPAKAATSGNGATAAAPAPAKAATPGNGASVRPPVDPRGNKAVTHEQIAQRAFEIYRQRGGGHGRSMEDWLQAERELRGA